VIQAINLRLSYAYAGNRNYSSDRWRHTCCRQPHGTFLPHSHFSQRGTISDGDALMFEDLRALAQPGAIIAVVVVLLLMAAGDAAITISIKGWPPL
jgi:hypothetical protein